MDFLSGGLRPYVGAPVLVELFWSALLPLDAAAVALLASGRRRGGLTLGLAIMLADVGVNSVVHYALDVPELGWALQLQSLFLGFLVGAVPFLWPRTPFPLSESIAAQP